MCRIVTSSCLSSSMVVMLWTDCDFKMKTLIYSILLELLLLSGVNSLGKITNFFSFFLITGGHESFLWGHWYPCFGLLVTSPLGSKARVALFTLGRGVYVTHSLRFSSGAAPADFLDASMAADPISSTYLRPGIGGVRRLLTYSLCRKNTQFWLTRKKIVL